MRAQLGRRQDEVLLCILCLAGRGKVIKGKFQVVEVKSSPKKVVHQEEEMSPELSPTETYGRRIINVSERKVTVLSVTEVPLVIRNFKGQSPGKCFQTII